MDESPQPDDPTPNDDLFEIDSESFIHLTPPPGHQVVVDFITFFGGSAASMVGPVLLFDICDRKKWDEWGERPEDEQEDPVEDRYNTGVLERIVIHPAIVGDCYLPFTVHLQRAFMNLAISGPTPEPMQILVSYRFSKMDW